MPAPLFVEGVADEAQAAGFLHTKPPGAFVLVQAGPSAYLLCYKRRVGNEVTSVRIEATADPAGFRFPANPNDDSVFVSLEDAVASRKYIDYHGTWQGEDSARPAPTVAAPVAGFAPGTVAPEGLTVLQSATPPPPPEYSPDVPPTCPHGVQRTALLVIAALGAVLAVAGVALYSQHGASGDEAAALAHARVEHALHSANERLVADVLRFSTLAPGMRDSDAAAAAAGPADSGAADAVTGASVRDACTAAGRRWRAALADGVSAAQPLVTDHFASGSPALRVALTAFAALAAVCVLLTAITTGKPGGRVGSAARLAALEASRAPLAEIEEEQRALQAALQGAPPVDDAAASGGGGGGGSRARARLHAGMRVRWGCAFTACLAAAVAFGAATARLLQPFADVGSFVEHAALPLAWLPPKAAATSAAAAAASGGKGAGAAGAFIANATAAAVAAVDVDAAWAALQEEAAAAGASKLWHAGDAGAAHRVLRLVPECSRGIRASGAVRGLLEDPPVFRLPPEGFLPRPLLGAWRQLLPVDAAPPAPAVGSPAAAAAAAAGGVVAADDAAGAPGAGPARDVFAPQHARQQLTLAGWLDGDHLVLPTVGGIARTIIVGVGAAMAVFVGVLIAADILRDAWYSRKGRPAAAAARHAHAE